MRRQPCLDLSGLRCIMRSMKRDETSRDEDVALVIGRDEERGALKVLRKRGDKIERGIVVAAEPGKPLMGDLVRLKPRPELPILCDVETLWEFREPRGSDEEAPRGTRHAGPCRVTSEAYRRGWDRTFGRRDPTDGPGVN